MGSSRKGPGDAVNVPGRDTEGTSSMQGERTPLCSDCNRPDDTGGEWFAYSVQFAAFLCFQCYQARHG